MAEAKRKQLKKVDSEQMAVGVYLATYEDGTTFRADLRDLPIVDGDGKIVGRLGETYDKLSPMVQRTLQYGIKQKLDDAIAGVDNVPEAVEEQQSTWDAILANKWVTRVPGEGVEGGLFARAFSAWKNLSLSDAKAKISELVDRNLKVNQEAQAAKPKEQQKEITERMVFNSLRDTYLKRNEDLNKIYEDLKAKKAEKAKNRPSGIEITTDE